MPDWFDLACGLWLLGTTLTGLLVLGIWLSRRPNPADEIPTGVTALLVGHAPQRQRLPVATPAVAEPPQVAAIAEPTRQHAPVSQSEFEELPSDPYQQWLESMQRTWQATPAYLH